MRNFGCPSARILKTSENRAGIFRLRPFFGHRARDLIEIGDAPFGTITHQ